ncbi:MAG: hypothetical protein KDD82_20975, partial [Planctomycetes bacterium]|nr:hypothetical protein [Planctomycetota bacterium]
PPEAVSRLTAELQLGFDDGGALACAFPFERLGDAALAIESALLTASGSPGPRYALRVEVVRAPQLVVEGARFAFAQEGREHTVEVEGASAGGLELAYSVRQGVQVVRGTRRLTADALAAASRHNPHYGRGENEQTDATSFCVSRAVAAALRRGEPAPFALLAKQERELGAAETARAVAWEGALEPRGTREVEVRVNGAPTRLTALVAGLGDRELLLLDDPRHAVGPLGQLTEVQTAIRARLVDEDGLGFAGVQVELGDVTLTTDLDGGFSIPPGAPGVADLSSALVAVTRTIDVGGEPQPEPLGSVGCDLSAPGLATVVLTLPRPRVDVRLIEPAAAAELEELAVSSQVKRHARRMLARGRTVAIPARMLDAGWGGEVAFFAHDPQSGNLVGVSEDGLHGATSNFGTLRNEIQSELMERTWEAREDLQKDGVHPIHMIRGVVVAFGVYATCRLKGMQHDEIVRHMLDQMEAWEKATNVFGGMPEQLADTEAGGLVSEVGNTNGSTSFYLGYLMALSFLHEQMGR